MGSPKRRIDLDEAAKQAKAQAVELKPVSVLIVKNLETSDLQLYKVSAADARAFVENNKDSTKIMAAYVEGIREICDASFLSLRDLARISNLFTGASLLKFKDRIEAAKRVVLLLDQVTASLPQPVKTRGRRPGCNLRPGPAESIRACRAGTVLSRLVDLLEHGATVSMLTGAAYKSGSTASLLSALNWDLNKRKGYGIRTDIINVDEARALKLKVAESDVINADSVLVYRLVVPQAFNGRNGPGTPPKHEE